MSVPPEEKSPSENPSDRKEGKLVSEIPKAQELASALQKLSEEKPRFLQEMMAMGISSVGNPLHHKMTSEHITQVLNLATAHDERQYNLTKQTNDNESNQKNFKQTVFFCRLRINLRNCRHDSGFVPKPASSINSDANWIGRIYQWGSGRLRTR